ncbi:DUF2249 domain-containing protein [Paenibacillus sp. M1]|uniref:DUF2249 domain-containing protein n=1 Tax=Paenibacillus haidiansis TaxID=1574488 RepID=A0ABU7VRF5_9BACL
MNRNDAKIIELDVRPQLRNKLEPFQLIMDTVKTLGQDDIFVLHATFKPTPLLGLLKMKGFVGKAEPQEDKDHWITTFVNKKNKHWLEESGEDDEADAPAKASRERQASSPAGADADTAEPKTIELDNRGLEPPQPMVRTLVALDRCRPGDRVRIHNDRVPVFLIEELNNMGCAYTVDEQPDGTAKVIITKA